MITQAYHSHISVVSKRDEIVQYTFIDITTGSSWKVHFYNKFAGYNINFIGNPGLLMAKLMDC